MLHSGVVIGSCELLWGGCQRLLCEGFRCSCCRLLCNGCYLVGLVDSGQLFASSPSYHNCYIRRAGLSATVGHDDSLSDQADLCMAG